MKNFILRYRFPIVLVLSFLCISGAVGLTRYYFVLKERELRAKIESETHAVPVVVARTDLAAGSKLDSTTVAVRPIPEAFVPSGAITPQTFGRYEGMVLSEPLQSGKSLLRHYIKGIAHAEKFSDLLQLGQRAITLQIDGVGSVEHMIEAGDFIDVAVRYKKGQGFDLLLERVLVLSTGNVTTADPKSPGMYKNADYSTITIGIDDRYVQRIYEANGRGELTFLLRNEKDELASHYSSYKISTGGVIFYSGKNADSGLLKESSEIATTSVANSGESAERNESGRIIQKSDGNPAPLNAENKETKEMVSNHE